MSRKVLCPTCGTVNRPAWRLKSRCQTCRKRLPLNIPRGLSYTARTLIRPLLVLVLLAGAFIAAPQFKTYRENLVVQKMPDNPRQP